MNGHTPHVVMLVLRHSAVEGATSRAPSLSSGLRRRIPDIRKEWLRATPEPESEGAP